MQWEIEKVDFIPPRAWAATSGIAAALRCMSVMSRMKIIESQDTKERAARSQAISPVLSRLAKHDPTRRWMLRTVGDVLWVYCVAEEMHGANGKTIVAPDVKRHAIPGGETTALQVVKKEG